MTTIQQGFFGAGRPLDELRAHDPQPHDWTTCALGNVALRCRQCGLYRARSDLDSAPGCPGAKTINVHLESDYVMQVADVWPDGDWPAVINAEAVASVMKQTGRARLTSEWDLAPLFHVSVDSSAEVQVDL